MAFIVGVTLGVVLLAAPFLFPTLMCGGHDWSGWWFLTIALYIPIGAGVIAYETT